MPMTRVLYRSAARLSAHYGNSIVTIRVDAFSAFDSTVREKRHSGATVPPDLLIHLLEGRRH